jgi:hypothetical protein
MMIVATLVFATLATAIAPGGILAQIKSQPARLQARVAYPPQGVPNDYPAQNITDLICAANPQVDAKTCNSTMNQQVNYTITTYCHGYYEQTLDEAVDQCGANA